MAVGQAFAVPQVSEVDNRSITQRAQNVCAMCGDLLALVDEIRNKAVPKTGECGQPPRPQPDHVVFALSQIEGDINSAMATLKLVADSI